LFCIQVLGKCTAGQSGQISRRHELSNRANDLLKIALRKNKKSRKTQLNSLADIMQIYHLKIKKPPLLRSGFVTNSMVVFY